MHRTRSLLLLILTILSVSASALTGDPQAGKEKSSTCVACHGATGNSENPEWPKIAGLYAPYFIKQMKAFQKGEDGCRNNAVMLGIASGLSDQDIVDLAAYYENQTRSSGETPENYLKRGQQLYRAGDREKEISACIACHGPQGKGNALANFPPLSGQHAAYVAAQLRAFRDTYRCNDQNHIMRDISARMSLEDMQAVGQYVQGLY